MQLPTQKLTQDEQKLLALKKKAASDNIYRLCVKIISWKSGKKTVKITSKEWVEYKKHIVGISKTESPERVLTKLKDTHQAIIKHGGFE
jgi:hypothetical protein